ncbi:hypothetical protein [Candidatus Methylopumilus universalis]|nr:hypothetical protein [Candidatus Methylopumilus universalis]
MIKSNMLYDRDDHGSSEHPEHPEHRESKGSIIIGKQHYSLSGIL